MLTFLYLLFPAIQAAKDEYAIRVDFPILAKFASGIELTRWKSDLPLSIVNSGKLPVVMHENVDLMKAIFSSKDASRVVLRFFAGDWQGYKSIKFSFFNPNDHVLQVRLIMTDRAYNQAKSNHNDRFGQWLMIKPGWGEFIIALNDIKNAPTEREMDLSEMSGVDFYMYHLQQPLVLYISKVELLSN
ncbi:hypothetical protein [Psychromonas sp. MME2]|uniref:hypothetical protein n=1 Tax=unclassified Psychromonas TaxID=2614957 RepID=UPI00339CF972